uniref:Transposase n=2 Tax=Parascaris univalens TaxID=6257 RepID=A0A915C5T6_PARUN
MERGADNSNKSADRQANCWAWHRRVGSRCSPCRRAISDEGRWPRIASPLDITAVSSLHEVEEIPTDATAKYATQRELERLDKCGCSSTSDIPVSDLDGNVGRTGLRESSKVEPIEELRSFDSSKLAELTSVSDEAFEKWLYNLNLLPKSRICECGREMKLMSWRTRKSWVCRRTSCARKRGFYSGTFLSGCHVPVKELFKLSYYWCIGTFSMDHVQKALRRDNGCTFSGKSVIEWYSFFRGICAGYFRLNPLRLGGEGKKVIIEEIMIMQEQTRKIKRGKEHWGFAGTEVGSKACFIEEIEEQLDADCLFPIIDKYVLPGTQVVSNLFKKYELDQQLREAYDHLACVKSLQFVGPEAGQGKSGIDQLWRTFKCSHKKKLDARTVASTHIKEFMWRRLFDGKDCMYHLWSQIACNYGSLRDHLIVYSKQGRVST